VLAGSRLAHPVGFRRAADTAGVSDIAEEFELIERHKLSLS